MPDPSMGPDQGPDQQQETPPPPQQAAGTPPDPTYYTLGAPTVDLTVGGAAVVTGSVQDLFLPLALTDAVTGGALDPTASGAGAPVPVQVAFTDGEDPADGDWEDAAWVTTVPAGLRFAAVTVSGLAPGAYYVFTRTAGYVGRAPGVLRVL